MPAPAECFCHAARAHRRERVDADRAGLGGDAAVGRHGQHVAQPVAADGRAQCRIGAVDLVAGHPRCGRVGLDRAADQHFGQGGFGRETPSISGDSSLLAAVSILGPRLGQVQGAVDQRVSTRRRVGQIDRDLGVLDPPGGAAVPALHPHRRGALLDVAGLVDLCRRRHRSTYPTPELCRGAGGGMGMLLVGGCLVGVVSVVVGMITGFPGRRAARRRGGSGLGVRWPGW